MLTYVYPVSFCLGEHWPISRLSVGGGSTEDKLQPANVAILWRRQRCVPGNLSRRMPCKLLDMFCREPVGLDTEAASSQRGTETLLGRRCKLQCRVLQTPW